MKTQFPLFQLKRAIALEGKTYLFKRPALDSTKEPIKGQYSLDVSVKGILHTSSSPYISITNSDSAAVQTKKTPQILALWNEVSQVQQGDVVLIGGNTFLVNGVDNIGDLGVVGDISLEIKL